MVSRAEILEAALDLLEEGVAVLDERSNVLFWNKAAAALTGHQREDVISLPCPEDLYRTDEEHRHKVGACPALPILQQPVSEELLLPTLVSIRHKQGHAVPGMLRRVALRDSQDAVTGAALLFYPVEESDALPHGEGRESGGVERGQAEMEDRLDVAQQQWLANRAAYGLLWIMVDQAPQLRKTHGQDACESMLRTVEQTLMCHINPAETIGRWGDDEFLVLAHERTVERLAEHAQYLAGHARTADFRWWGDRVAITVSIGLSQAREGDTLQRLLCRARQAMQTSSAAGGNHVTKARGE
jgi:diguanylate cyclase (GGDEF)-like protein/PAS domain S-box-containing protein